MRITFFGSSHGIPEPNRRCSSTLIEVGESRYFIDMGTQSVEQLVTRHIPIASVKAVFVTHMHGDHTDGLISFVDLCSWAFKGVSPKLYLPGDVEAAKTAIGAWLACNDNTLGPLEFCSVQPGLLYDDGVLRVTAYPTKHIAVSYAYLVETEGKRVLFSGDLSNKGPREDFPVSVLEAPLDLSICESAHFDATQYLPLLEGNGNLKRLCFNHYSDRFLPSVLSMFNSLPGVEVFRACDGTEITL